jgi:hypothetical protein
MDESTQSPDDRRGSPSRHDPQDRTTITSPPSVRTHASVAEQTAAAAGSGDRSRVEPATQGAGERGSGTDSGIVERVRERAGAQLATQKDLATDGIGTIARAVRKTTQDLRDQRHETLAEYVERAADQLERLSSGLKNRDVGDLFRDAQNLARRQPVMFVGSAFALGLIGARFLKSSSPEGGRQPAWQRLTAGVDPSPAHLGYRYSQASAYGQPAAAPGPQHGTGSAGSAAQRGRDPGAENI